jgi:hypothetical protein
MPAFLLLLFNIVWIWSIDVYVAIADFLPNGTILGIEVSLPLFLIAR